MTGGYPWLDEPHPTATRRADPDLPLDLVCLAITAGCSPRQVEIAVTERGRDDTLLALALETDVSMTIIAALQDRWGIAP